METKITTTTGNVDNKSVDKEVITEPDKSAVEIEQDEILNDPLQNDSIPVTDIRDTELRNKVINKRQKLYPTYIEGASPLANECIKRFNAQSTQLQPAEFFVFTDKSRGQGEPI